MSSLSPSVMASSVGSGLLSFPVTSFDQNLAFDEASYREHCSYMLEHEVAALFAAGGTGEFFSLTPAEVTRVVAAAVAQTGGQVPVIAGCGYGTAIAMQMAREAEGAGADGLLLLPPYLMAASQEGLAAHVEAVCRSTGLGVIMYNRDNAVLQPDTLARLCERNANLVGLKDGLADFELIARTRSLLGDRLIYVGGPPTAETFALPYLEVGVTTYSSAIYNFMPEWALAFYRAVRARDHAHVAQAMETFLVPYLALRDRGRGYAVSIVKAGLRAVGRDAGRVRTPLTDLTEAEERELSALIEQVR